MTELLLLLVTWLGVGTAASLIVDRPRRTQTLAVLQWVYLWPLCLLAATWLLIQDARAAKAKRARRDADRLVTIVAQVESGDLDVAEAVRIASTTLWPAPVLNVRKDRQR